MRIFTLFRVVWLSCVRLIGSRESLGVSLFLSLHFGSRHLHLDLGEVDDNHKNHLLSPCVCLSVVLPLHYAYHYYYCTYAYS